MSDERKCPCVCFECSVDRHDICRHVIKCIRRPRSERTSAAAVVRVGEEDQPPAIKASPTPVWLDAEGNTDWQAYASEAQERNRPGFDPEYDDPFGAGWVISDEFFGRIGEGKP